MINIAIDGPSGAGKSTVAKGVAKELGFIYVDTGALYRSVGVSVLRKGFDTRDSAKVVPLLDGINITIKHIDHNQHVYLNDEDISEEIRLPASSMAASNVSAIPAVRSFLFELQRDIAKKNNCIMDGRDIGTVVLPNADLKIFLTASTEERAQRRYKELIGKGNKINYKELLEEIKQRDYNDSNREIAPLKPAEDAVIFDSTGLSAEAAIRQVIELVRSKLDI